MRIEVSTTIDRPVAEVWRWYAVKHVRHHPRWDPDMQLEQVSEGPIGLGTKIRRRNVRWGEPIEGEMEIVEWEPERAMATRIRAQMEWPTVTFRRPCRPHGVAIARCHKIDDRRREPLAMMQRSVEKVKRLADPTYTATSQSPLTE